MVQQLVAEYGSGYDQVKNAISGLTKEELQFKPAPDKWSIHEIIIHLADAEIVGVHRMKRVLAEDNPTLTAYNQDAWADALQYSLEDAARSLELFGLLRQTMLPALLRAEEADWQRCGIHEEAGPLTLAQLLERYVNHVRGHLAQMNRVLAAYREKQAQQ